MVSNFSLIQNLISDMDKSYTIPLDKDADSFYVVQLIKRKKDNPTMKGDCLVFKRYHIHTVSELDSLKEEIISLCSLFNLRAYFDVNRKSYRKCALSALVEVSKLIAEGNFKKTYSIMDSVIGKYQDSSNKKWIVDIDIEDSEQLGIDHSELVRRLTETIEIGCKPCKKIIGVIPTKSGTHLITDPFDIITFSNIVGTSLKKPIGEFVHKHAASTILYTP